MTSAVKRGEAAFDDVLPSLRQSARRCPSGPSVPAQFWVGFLCSTVGAMAADVGFERAEAALAVARDALVAVKRAKGTH